MKHDFYKIKVDVVDKKEFFSKVEEFYRSDEVHLINFLNAHCYNLACENTAYKDALLESSILLNDGIGIKIASAMIGLKMKENMNGTDLIPLIIKNAIDSGKKIFLLGGEEGIAHKVRQKIGSDQVVGIHSGFFKPEDEDSLARQINESEADLLIIGMGVPRQELWIIRNRHKLAHLKLAVCGGAILDFMAGKYPRAPKIFRTMGIEWIFRLSQEPKRLANRYLVGNFKFMFRVIVERLRMIFKKQ